MLADCYQRTPSLLLLRRNYIEGGSFYIRSRLCEFGIRNSQQSTDNGQQSTVRGNEVAELVEAPNVVPSTGSGAAHEVCCPLTVVC